MVQGDTRREWCAHLAAVCLVYRRQGIGDADPDEALVRLWRQYRRGGEA